MIEPRHDRVLIQRIERQGPIILTDGLKSIRGKVLAIGPDVYEVKPGDLVDFNSKWNDLASRDYYHDLPLGSDPEVHLVQEADIFWKVSDSAIQATMVDTRIPEVIRHDTAR